MKNANFCLDLLLLCLSACFGDASSFQRKLYKTCTQKQRVIEAESWAGAKMLAEATNLWVPSKDYQEATDMYMGPDSASEGGLFSPRFRQYIQSNEQRALNLFNGQADFNSYLYIACDESPWWFKYCQDGWMAYESDNTGIFWSNFYITLCPLFYERPSLQDALQNVTNGLMSPNDLSNFRATQGGMYYHEMMHMRGVVSSPKTYDKDGAYGGVWGPLAVYTMARDKWRGTLSAYKIADAYHMKAMAILLQSKFRLPHPPLPHDLLPAGSEAVNSWSEVDFEDATFNTTLQVLGSNPNISNSAPNPTDWLDPAPPPSNTVESTSSSSLPPTSTAQPLPSAPNRAILISYEQVFASLEQTDSFLATAFTPGDSSLGEPCNADTLGTGKVSNGDTSLPASMDVVFEGVDYTFFTAQEDDFDAQLVESRSGDMVASCLLLLAQTEQTCGIEGIIILTPRATCEWHE